MSWLEYLQAVDWATISETVIGAGIGTGLVQGGFALYRERCRRRAQVSYLAIRLATALEAFGIACTDLIWRNFSAYHPPDEELPDWKIKLPEVAAYPEDGADWIALDRELVNRCLSLRNKRDDSQRLINGHRDHAEDEDELAEVVEQQAAARGLEAWHLAQELRRHYGFEDDSFKYDFAERLAEASERAAESIRQRRQRTQKTLMKRMRMVEQKI